MRTHTRRAPGSRATWDLRVVIDIEGDLTTPEEPGRLRRVNGLLRDRDHYFLCADFAGYVAIQERIDAACRTPRTWTARVIKNIAGMGHFSSDRTIREYCRQIWTFRQSAFLASGERRFAALLFARAARRLSDLPGPAVAVLPESGSPAFKEFRRQRRPRATQSTICLKCSALAVPKTALATLTCQGGKPALASSPHGMPGRAGSSPPAPPVGFAVVALRQGIEAPRRIGSGRLAMNPMPFSCDRVDLISRWSNRLSEAIKPSNQRLARANASASFSPE